MSGGDQWFTAFNTNFYDRWDEPSYEMVCLIIASQGMSDQMMLGEVMPALFDAGVLLPDGTYEYSKAGNVTVISRSNDYIDSGLVSIIH
jgi:hypothetical protein